MERLDTTVMVTQSCKKNGAGMMKSKIAHQSAEMGCFSRVLFGKRTMMKYLCDRLNNANQ